MNKIIVLVGASGSGKAEDIETLIPTPEGKKRFGDLKIGDYVFDRTGAHTKVLGVFPQGELDAYKVTLSDGRSMICNDEHIFTTITSRGNYKNRTVKDMIDGGVIKTSNGVNGTLYESRYKIPTHDAVEYTAFNDDDIEIHPYVVGAFIGDGCLTGRVLSISSDDEFVVKKVAQNLGLEYYKNSENNYSWSFRHKNELKIMGINKHVYYRKLAYTSDIFNENFSVLAKKKVIPENYKYNTIENRYSLLQGLFDTDGSACLSNGKLNISYSTSSKRLAEDVRELILSLGYNATIYTDDRDCKGDSYVNYTVGVMCDNIDKHKFFTLPRKKEIAENGGIIRIKRNYNTVKIRNIEKLPKKMEMMCIMVDNDEHLYLTNDFIVTHNTTIGKELEKHGVENLLSFTTREQRSGEQHMVDYRFIDEAELGRQLLMGNVVEMTEYNGHKYGLLKRDVDYIMSSGSDVYFICDKNGASQIKEMYPEKCTQFFIKIDMETMMDRMLKRGDDVDSVLKRIYHAYIKDELKAPLGSFVLNGKYFNAVENAECILNCMGVDE